MQLNMPQHGREELVKIKEELLSSTMYIIHYVREGY